MLVAPNWTNSSAKMDSHPANVLATKITINLLGKITKKGKGLDLSLTNDFLFNLGWV